jgi:hypothetical protein
MRTTLEIDRMGTEVDLFPQVKRLQPAQGMRQKPLIRWSWKIKGDMENAKSNRLRYLWMAKRDLRFLITLLPVLFFLYLAVDSSFSLSAQPNREQIPPPVFPYPNVPPPKLPEAPPQKHGLDLTKRDYETARAYWKYLCDTEAGIFIYQTAKDVEAVFQMRPRGTMNWAAQGDPYYFEDPWGRISLELRDGDQSWYRSWLLPGVTGDKCHRATHYQSNVYLPSFGYSYFERPLIGNEAVTDRGNRYIQFQRTPGILEHKVLEDGSDCYSAPRNTEVIEKVAVDELRSEYGYFWRGIERSPHDRELGVAGGETIVVNLKTNDVMGIYRGFVLGRGPRGPLIWTEVMSCPRPAAIGLLMSQVLQRKVK